MGYVLPRGSSRYKGPAQSGGNEKAKKPSPASSIQLPRPVKIPPPPSPAQSAPPK
jgi:hypothetical protein